MRTSPSPVEVAMVLIAILTVAALSAYAILYGGSKIAPIADTLRSPDPSAEGKYLLKMDQPVTLVTTLGQQYRVTVSQTDDGYYLSIQHPAHEAALVFTDDNPAEMSWTMHVGEIFLQRDRNTWRLWYPNGWTTVTS